MERFVEASIEELTPKKKSQRKQIITAAYGPNRRRFRPQFWKDIRSIRNGWNLPWIIGRDFNDVRFQE